MNQAKTIIESCGFEMEDRDKKLYSDQMGGASSKYNPTITLNIINMADGFILSLSSFKIVIQVKPNKISTTKCLLFERRAQTLQ